MNNQDWNEYKILVLKELEAARVFQNRIDNRLDKIDIDLAVLKSKIGMAQVGLGTVFASLIGVLIKMFIGGG